VLTRRVEKYKRVLAGPDAWYTTLSNEEKYLYLHYRVSLADSAEFDRKRKQITVDDWKINAITDRAKWLVLESKDVLIVLERLAIAAK
jgi:hypothetical protein